MLPQLRAAIAAPTCAAIAPRLSQFHALASGQSAASCARGWTLGPDRLRRCGARFAKLPCQGAASPSGAGIAAASSSSARTAAGKATTKRARLHGRPLSSPRQPSRRSLAPALESPKIQLETPTAAASEDSPSSAAVEELQGEWGDDIGLKISISGREARFTDGTEVFTIEEEGGTILLRGAALVGTPQQPVWRFPNGLERRWARVDPAGTGDTSWANLFHKYKGGRLQLRRQLSEAITAYDFSELSRLRVQWADDNNASIPPEANYEERARLIAGRFLATGVCVRHRKFNYRGVILGGEPWCSAPVRWRAQMGVASLPGGEAQPFYHTVVDERDRPGGQVTFCAEENLEPCEEAFPIQSALVEAWLVPGSGLGGYLAGPKLEEMLLSRGQDAGGRGPGAGGADLILPF